jgi:hypothetical protein
MKIETQFKNVEVTLVNSKGEKFTQNIGSSGLLFLPPDYFQSKYLFVKDPTSGDKQKHRFRLFPVPSQYEQEKKLSNSVKLGC